MPTIFLSAATIDLEPLREVLHTAFSRADFQVYTQNHSLGAAPGDVRRLLRRHIEGSDCVIHLAGMGYGKDAQDPFPEDPDFVCSWTQFEYYYAHAIGKDVIAFVLAPNLSQPGFQEAGDESEREGKARRQAAHRERIVRGVFDGTPLAGEVKRTSNEQVGSEYKLVECVAAAIGTLHQHEPAWKKLSGELEKLHQEIASLRAELNDGRRAGSGIAEKSTAATFTIKWPTSLSYFLVGGRQAIRWEVFAAHDFLIRRYEIELYFEETRIAKIGAVEGTSAASCRSFAWDSPDDLQQGNDYRIRLLAWDAAGRMAEGFSQRFRMRKVNLTTKDEGWGKILLLYSALGGGAGLVFGTRVLGPWVFKMLQGDFFGADCISQVFKFVFLLPQRHGWQAIAALVSIEFCASLTAVAIRMCLVCAPARAIIPALTVVGVAGGHALEVTQGGLWNESQWGAFPGGAAGLFLGVAVVQKFCRGEEDANYVLEANVKFWQTLGRYIRTAWRWIVGKLKG